MKTEFDSNCEEENVPTAECEESTNRPEIFALIHFPFLNYLGPDREYGIHNENNFWNEVSDSGKIAVGCEVFVKSRDQEEKLRLDKGIVKEISGEKHSHSRNTVNKYIHNVSYETEPIFQIFSVLPVYSGIRVNFFVVFQEIVNSVLKNLASNFNHLHS